MITYYEKKWIFRGHPFVWVLRVGPVPCCHVCWLPQAETGRCLWCNVAAHRDCRSYNFYLGDFTVCKDCQVGDL